MGIPCKKPQTPSRQVENMDLSTSQQHDFNKQDNRGIQHPRCGKCQLELGRRQRWGGEANDNKHLPLREQKNNR